MATANIDQSDLEAAHFLLCLASNLSWPAFARKYNCYQSMEKYQNIEIFKPNYDEEEELFLCKKVQKKRRSSIPSEILRNTFVLNIDSTLTSTPIRERNEIKTTALDTKRKKLSDVNLLDLSVVEFKKNDDKQQDLPSSTEKIVISKSGRVLKRPKHLASFISTTTDDDKFESKVPISKIKEEIVESSFEKSAEVINFDSLAKSTNGRHADILQKAKLLHRQKKLKVDSNMQIVSNENSDQEASTSTALDSNPKTEYVDIFQRKAKSRSELIGGDSVRHSRLYDIAYEIQNKEFTNAMDAQCRAAEVLNDYKKQLQIKREQLFERESRNTKTAYLMHKLYSVANRDEICNAFLNKFKPTECKEWKPFSQDPERLQQAIKYKIAQQETIPKINELLQKYDEIRSDSKMNVNNRIIVPPSTNQIKLDETALTVIDEPNQRRTSILVEIFKLLPNRSEVRHSFVSKYMQRSKNPVKSTP